jgi:hypothetical protein
MHGQVVVCGFSFSFRMRPTIRVVGTCSRLQLCHINYSTSMTRSINTCTDDPSTTTLENSYGDMATTSSLCILCKSRACLHGYIHSLELIVCLWSSHAAVQCSNIIAICSALVIGAKCSEQGKNMHTGLADGGCWESSAKAPSSSPA